uniref:Uncharacterized protein n=1 Tax=Anguilla anguilla TaxID=7936 RepID=A0A0E9QCL7_ANGAN
MTARKSRFFALQVGSLCSKQARLEDRLSQDITVSPNPPQMFLS